MRKPNINPSELNLKNFEDTINKFKNAGTGTPKSIQGYINRFVIPNLPKNDPIRERYLEYLTDLQQEYYDSIPKKELSYSIETLRELWLKYQSTTVNNDTNSRYLLLTGLYIWMPTKRTTDYLYATDNYTDGHIYLSNQSKINRELSTRIKIHENMYTYVKDYLQEAINLANATKNPTNAWNNKVKIAEKHVYGKELNNHDIRSAYTKHIGNDVEERMQLAKDMNHRLETSVQIYSKKQLKDEGMAIINDVNLSGLKKKKFLSMERIHSIQRRYKNRDTNNYIYFLIYEGKIIYVGTTNNLDIRIYEHISGINNTKYSPYFTTHLYIVARELGIKEFDVRYIRIIDKNFRDIENACIHQSRPIGNSQIPRNVSEYHAELAEGIIMNAAILDTYVVNDLFSREMEKVYSNMKDDETLTFYEHRAISQEILYEGRFDMAKNKEKIE